MEATGFRPQGSFGIPEQLKKQLEESKQRPAPEPSQESAAKATEPKMEPVAKSSDPESDDQEYKDRQEILNFKKMWEARLGISITHKDVREYILRGRLVKEGIIIVPGYMLATFQTHNPSELAAIDQTMAAFRETVKFTPDGLSNESAVQVLSYGWIKAALIDEDDQTQAGNPAPYRSLGENPEQRRKAIQSMGSLLVASAAECWDGFNVLIKLALKEKQILKK